jgi:hypothetical protein
MPFYARLMGSKEIAEETKEKFEARGRDPRAWQETALALHQAAVVLWDHADRTDWPDSYPAFAIALMLEAFAVENLAKAMLVHRDPNLVQDGEWKGPRRGHPLLDLLQQARFDVAADRDLVRRLERFVETPRYPIPLKFDRLIPERKGLREFEFPPEPANPSGRYMEVELARGTYFEAGDREKCAALIARLDGRLREELGAAGQ